MVMLVMLTVVMVTVAASPGRLLLAWLGGGQAVGSRWLRLPGAKRGSGLVRCSKAHYIGMDQMTWIQFRWINPSCMPRVVRAGSTLRP